MYRIKTWNKGTWAPGRLCWRGHSAQGEAAPSHLTSLTFLLLLASRSAYANSVHVKNICKALSTTDPLDFFMHAWLLFIKMYWEQVSKGRKDKRQTCELRKWG